MNKRHAEFQREMKSSLDMARRMALILAAFDPERRDLAAVEIQQRYVETLRPWSAELTEQPHFALAAAVFQLLLEMLEPRQVVKKRKRAKKR